MTFSSDKNGVRGVRIDYRSPNDLDRCAHDLACGVEWARDAGAARIVVMGHSFGGAVAIRAAVVKGLPGEMQARLPATA